MGQRGKIVPKSHAFQVLWPKLLRERGYCQKSREEDDYLQAHEETEIAKQRDI